MILQNIMQYVETGSSMQRIHRGLPRLCCKSCFEKNLLEEDSYLSVLKHGIMYHAAKNMLKINEGVESFTMSANSLFTMYERCGMQAAVDETIFVNTQAGLNSLGGEFEKMKIKVGSVSLKEAMAKKDTESAERCEQVD